MSHCPNCGAPTPAGATFCAHCGQKIQLAPPPASFGAPAVGSHFLGTPMRVCPGCGVIAPTQRTTCAVCNTGFGPMPPMVPPMPEGRYWGVIIEADFICRGCGVRAPLDGLNIAGEAHCRNCNLRQGFDPEQWGEALALTQNVADLAGPPGRRQPYEDNPFTAVGVTDTWDEMQSEGPSVDRDGTKQRSLRVRAAPGHPLCQRCKAPLDIALDGQGRAQTTCPRCRDQAVYALPPDYDDQNIDLLAVISEEHRVDRPGTRGSGPKSRPIWCLFEDESPMRSGVADEDDDEDEHHHHHHDHDHDHDDDDDRAAYLRAAQAAQARQQAASQRPQSGKPDGASSIVGVVAIGVGVLAIVGVLVLVVLKTRSPEPSASDKADKKEDEASEKKASKKKKAAAAEEDDEPAPAKKAPPAKVAIDLSKFKRLDGCTCSASLEGKGGITQMQLMVRLEREDKLKGSDATGFAAAWTIDITGKPPYALAQEGDPPQAPPREIQGRGISVGVACTKDAFIVVSGDRADGWSTTSDKHVWGARLPGNYGVVAVPSEGGLNIQCNTVPVVGKSLRVPLVGGKFQMLDVATGK